MTNLAQRVETREHREFLDSQPQPGPLPLTGNQPVPVIMQPAIDPVSNLLVATFASPSKGTFFFGGLQWLLQPGTDNALFINFTFVPNGTLPTITSIDCDAPIPLLYSPVGTDMVSQSCAVPPVQGTYKFHVTFSNGLKHDPEIVVTPQ